MSEHETKFQFKGLDYILRFGWFENYETFYAFEIPAFGNTESEEGVLVNVGETIGEAKLPETLFAIVKDKVNVDLRDWKEQLEQDKVNEEPQNHKTLLGKLYKNKLNQMKKDSES